MDPYDAVPYEGRAVPLAHPDRLAVAALRAGLRPEDPSSASILELGCAEGGNLLPIAYHLDGARCLGIDGSRVQIETATEGRDRLGLDNLELRHADFRALSNEDLGTYDYVLVHGVLSWVDAETRGVLLDLVRRALAPEGVAYLSYNCAAGWALKRELRELLLRATIAMEAPEAKIAKSRELLVLLAASPLRDASLHAAALAERAKAALAHRDAYLLHEYLAPHNHAFRHREIRELSTAHGLSFVTELAWTTSRADFEDNLVSKLRREYPDPIEAEELADLMLGRAFRASVFCRADAGLEAREPQLATLSERAVFRGLLRPESKRISLEPGINEGFLAASGAKIAAKHPVLKAAMLELHRAWPGGLTIPELQERAALLLELRRVAGVDARSSETREAITNDLLELSRLEHLEARLHAPPFAHETSATPRVESLTRYEAERGPAVTTPHHTVLALDPFARLLVRHLDGVRPIDELVRLMDAHASHELSLTNEEGEPLEGEARAAAVRELVERTIETLRRHALLSA